MAIFILRGQIQSGKTTRLFNWSKQQKDVGGFLTPDIHGIRWLFDLRQKTSHPFQVKKEDKGTLKVGRFYFLLSSFEIGRQILKRDLQQKCAWLIIDEIGPLELKGKGFEPQISQAINVFKNETEQRNLLIVVRETLFKVILDHYDIKRYQLFNFSSLNH